MMITTGLPTYKDILLVLTISILANSMAAIAQDGEDWRLYKPKKDSTSMKLSQNSGRTLHKPGKINIVQPADIERLDSLKKMHPTKPSGYRVQIFFGKREEAREKKLEFIKKYPEIGAYISYLAPNFRLRVGDFRTKIACEEFKREISEDFPASYIVKDKVEFLEFSVKESD